MNDWDVQLLLRDILTLPRGSWKQQYLKHPHGVSGGKSTFSLTHFSAVLSLPDSPVLTTRVAVTIHVLDINEFPPELASPYETFVCENAKVGQVWMGRLFFLDEMTEYK